MTAYHGKQEVKDFYLKRLARLEDGIFEDLPSPKDVACREAFLGAVSDGADLSLVWPCFAVVLLADEQYGVLRCLQHSQYVQEKKAIEKVVAYYKEWISTTKKPSPAHASNAADPYAAAADAYAVADPCAANAAAAAAYAAAAADTDDYAAAYAAEAAAAADAYAVADPCAAYASAAAAEAAAAADAAARQKHRAWQADTLLRLLRGAPQPRMS
jgi:hypothetical protein